MVWRSSCPNGFNSIYRPQSMDKKNVYIVTGDAGIGMTHSTIAGISSGI